MGAAGSVSTLPYASVEDAKKDGKTQAEIDEWLTENQVSRVRVLGSELDALYELIKKTKSNMEDVGKELGTASGSAKMELEQAYEEMREEIKVYRRKERILSEKIDAAFEEELKAIAES